MGMIYTFPCCFFFNDTATTEIYTLSLHDALPISPDTFTAEQIVLIINLACTPPADAGRPVDAWTPRDRKSTRLNSSHANISYAVFCLKKKKSDFKGSRIWSRVQIYRLGVRLTDAA